MSRYLAIAILCLFTIGCTSTESFHKNHSMCSVTSSNYCDGHSILSFSDPDGEELYHLGFVEINDQGQLHHPPRYVNGAAQGSAVLLEHLKKVSEQEDVLLITFVHGWHHNAKRGSDVTEEDSNITDFRNKVLAQAAKFDSRKVIGVYIGWRGRVLPDPLDTLTFWDRKNTAQEVGYQGMTEYLLKMESALSSVNDHRMITIGHSFGGASLYSALHPVLAERYVRSRMGNSETIDGFGDLVVLLNPAFEATRYSGLFELAQDDCRDYSEQQKKRLVMLSSFADKPVRYAFPIGRSLSTLFESHNMRDTLHCDGNKASLWTVNEASADIHAVGHYAPYVTWLMDKLGKIDERTTVELSDPVEKIASFNWHQGMKAGAYRFNDTFLVSKHNSHPFNPYMNITTYGSVMKHHNDIWNPTVSAFVYSLIREATK